MRDWTTFVRSRLRLTGLTPAREARIVRELAVQLEDFYRDGLARGLSESDADGEARRQISDWDRLGGRAAGGSASCGVAVRSAR